MQTNHNYPVNIQNISRRKFLKGTGATLACFTLQCNIGFSANASEPSQKTKQALNLFVSIDKNNQVVLTCHRSEMGQGIRTSIAQIIADELEADWQYVQVTQAVGDKKYGNQNTDGSKSIRSFYQPLRVLGASAKFMLQQAAAQVWQVPIEECIALNHKVTHSSGQSLSYGELAQLAAKQSVPDTQVIKLKNKDEFKYIGKGLMSLDMEHFVNGSSVYGQDIHLPNMLYACLKRCPVMSGKIASFNAHAATQITGVEQIIEIEGQPLPAHFNPVASVAVLAKNTWAAMKGVKALDVKWQSTEYDDYDSEKTLLEKQNQIKHDDSKQVSLVKTEQTTPADLFTHEAIYTLPYIAHAPMEPPAATAMFHTDGSVEIWSCVQAPQAVQRKVSQVLAIDVSKVKVNVTLLGGAFGRKAQIDFTVEAVLLAQKAQRPVKVVWDREDDIQNDYYHTSSVQLHHAKLSTEKGLFDWQTKSCFTPIQSLWNIKKEHAQGFEMRDIIRKNFNIPSMKTESVARPAQTRIGWLRSVANIQHGFSTGCFMDEVAEKLNIDIQQHWQTILEGKKENQGLQNVIHQVCKNAHWTARKSLPSDEGLGLAAHRSFASDIAIISHVKVIENKLTIKKVYCCADVGTVVNIDRVKAQMEGAVIFGLSIALHNKISFKNGRVTQSNFHDYPVLRMHETPEIEVHIVDSDAPPGGVGEPGLPPLAPSVCNAIYATTGKRYRQLPLKQFFSV
ncbi:molybdopterin cofactor-binding domain-containing protein [Catenovulum sediminis]|uniref:Molybdopterin cofactor-binding domain-containing protein n=2 Tax=Catenovulum sediminis TaxID=1740262 RepID=A0ABV1REJ8_9ALTE